MNSISLILSDLFQPGHRVVDLVLERTEIPHDLVRLVPELAAELVGDRRQILGTVSPHAYLPDGPIYVGPGATIEPGSYVEVGSYIGPGATVRHGAYMREGCILLDGALLGHASEAKHALFLTGAKAPHFAYVGDSVLGAGVNLGAGSKLSNVRVRPGTVTIPAGQSRIDTGLRKFGAVLGDQVQTGCNATLNPGVIVGPRTLIYPGVVVPPGVYPADSLVRSNCRVTVEPE